MSQAKPEPRHFVLATAYATVASVLLVAAGTAVVAMYWNVIKFVWSLLT